MNRTRSSLCGRLRRTLYSGGLERTWFWVARAEDVMLQSATFFAPNQGDNFGTLCGYRLVLGKGVQEMTYVNEHVEGFSQFLQVIVLDIVVGNPDESYFWFICQQIIAIEKMKRVSREAVFHGMLTIVPTSRNIGGRWIYALSMAGHQWSTFQVRSGHCGRSVFTLLHSVPMCP